MSDVTVLIPLGLKHLALVGRAVESALAQTYPVHVLIANNSGEAVHVEGATVLDVDCPDGLTGAQKAAYSRNVALEGIQTRYTLFLDADDTLTRPAIEMLRERIEQGGADYAYGDWYAVRNGEAKYTKSYEFDRTVLLDKNLHAVTALVQTQQALKVGGFDESLAYWEDWGFWVRMVAKGYKGARVPYATFSYYLEEGENRNNGHKVARQIYEQVRAQYGQRFRELEGTMCRTCGGGGTPVASLGFQELRGGTMQGVQMEYIGTNKSNLSYKVPKTNRKYLAADIDGSRFIEAHPDDVKWLTDSGMFRVVKAPSVPDAPFEGKAPKAGVTETANDSDYLTGQEDMSDLYYAPDTHSQDFDKMDKLGGKHSRKVVK